MGTAESSRETTMRPTWTFDRRRLTRVRGPGAIELEVIGLGEVVRVRDVGTGGAVVSLARPLTPNARYDILVRLSDGRCWTAGGRVVHCRAPLVLDAARRPRYVAGIAFEDLPDEAVQALDALVARLTAGQDH
jgi:hypothetical protein